MDTPLVVLVIEDDNVAYVFLERLFRQYPESKLVWAQSLKEGLEALENHQIDVILLDLSLPDSFGVATVKKFMELETAPIVVLSGMDNEETALESVQLGAQDYLVKGRFDDVLLFRTIRYAIERSRLHSELRASQQEVQRERELRRLQSNASQVQQSTDRLTDEGKSLKCLHARLFKLSVKKYASILDDALEQRTFKVEHNVSDELKTLASELCAHMATPRDVVEIHTETITSRLLKSAPEKKRIVNEEARYLVAGLLGHLCSFYRSNSLRNKTSEDQMLSCLDTDVTQ